MARKNLLEKITVPDGVSVSFNNSELVLTGSKGELKRTFLARKIDIKVDGNSIVLKCDNAAQEQKKMFFTFRAHMNNMIKGVLEGFTYKLKVCSGHFPMSVALKGDVFEVKNFIGEKVPRTVKIKSGADVKINGDVIVVTGINKEVVGQVAADIEKLTKRPGFDKRIFQDGIYITEKDGKVL